MISLSALIQAPPRLTVVDLKQVAAEVLKILWWLEDAPELRLQREGVVKLVEARVLRKAES